MKKQTAVEWLENELKSYGQHHTVGLFKSVFDKAKSKEKQQIVDANIAGMEFIPADPNRYNEDAEQYYESTFKTYQE